MEQEMELAASARQRATFVPLAHFSREECTRVRAVLCDIDDTLTEHGRLPSVAYSALEALRNAGLIVVPVTGRPAGWCDLIARQWPVDAVVGENGAFYFRYDDANRRMIRRYARSDSQRAADRQLLDLIEAAVLEEVPGSAVAADQSYREGDLAIDFSEDVARLPDSSIEQIVRIFELHGATAKVSSIHVNGWFGEYDKLTTSLKLLADEFGIDARADETQVVYAGDSPNDAPMFGYFSHSVGVANCLEFAGQLSAAPHWITDRPYARGFAELARHLLEGR